MKESSLSFSELLREHHYIRWAWPPLSKLPKPNCKIGILQRNSRLHTIGPCSSSRKPEPNHEIQNNPVPLHFLKGFQIIYYFFHLERWHLNTNFSTIFNCLLKKDSPTPWQQDPHAFFWIPLGHQPHRLHTEDKAFSWSKFTESYH